MILHTAGPSDLDAPTLYALLKLRTDVFVVEQACPYPELDGRDLDAGTEHRWFEDDEGPTAYVRLLAEPAGETRLGRVVTRPDARGAGLAQMLLEGVLADHPGPVLADAQSHLVAWYEALGFQVTGPEYLEDDIPHVPMRRPLSPSGARFAGHGRQIRRQNEEGSVGGDLEADGGVGATGPGDDGVAGPDGADAAGR